MGKSHPLLARAHAAALGEGQAVSYIDFQLIDRDKLCDLNSLLRYLAARLARALKTARKPKDCWDPMPGAKDSLTEFVEDAVLNPAAGQVSLLFDEADEIFEQSAYRDDFFATLRAWTNRRASHVPWANLNLVIAHSTEPALWIQNLNESPFNVGFRFKLGDLSLAQVHDLNARYGGVLTDPEIGQLYDLIGGQPFLVRQALHPAGPVVARACGPGDRHGRALRRSPAAPELGAEPTPGPPPGARRDTARRCLRRRARLPAPARRRPGDGSVPHRGPHALLALHALPQEGPLNDTGAACPDEFFQAGGTLAPDARAMSSGGPMGAVRKGLGRRVVLSLDTAADGEV